MAQDIIHYNPCCKIDAADIDAWFGLYLDEDNLSHLWYDTPWGKDYVDLKPALEAAMVAGKLELYPEQNPNSLRYVKGSAYDEILGEDLSRIVWMRHLKDVEQGEKLTDGDVYMYDATTELFRAFNLTSVLNAFDSRINDLDARVSALEINYQSFNSLLEGIESTLADFEARIKTLEEGGIIPPSPGPEPEITPYGFLIYNDNGTDKYYPLASEEDFNKLGTTSFTQNVSVQFQDVTVNSEDFRGYDFAKYKPTELPDTFMARATLKYPLNIPDSVTNIGEDFLSGATINATIKLPDGLQEIPGSFLYYSVINAAITLPNTVASIGEQFLGYCEYRYAQPITLPTSLKTIGDSFMSRVLGPGRTYGYPFEVIIPEGVTTIGAGFMRYLLTGSVVEAPKPPTRIVIPASVTSIGFSFMDNCTNAIEIVANTTAVPAADKEGESNLWTLAMTTGSTTMGNNLPAWTKGITIKGDGAEAWTKAFPNLDGKANKVNTTTYYMRRKLIWDGAPVLDFGVLTYTDDSGSTKTYELASEADFNKLGVGTKTPTPTDTYDLEGATVKVMNVKGYDFRAYTPTTLPQGFLGGAELTQPLNIPNSVTNINGYFLRNAEVLAPITISEKVTSIPTNFLNGAYIKAKVTLPPALSSIGSNFLLVAEYDYSSPLEFPSTLRSIGEYFMANMLYASGSYGYPFKLELPEGLTSIGSRFLICRSRSNLPGDLYNPPTEIVIPSTVKSIGREFMTDFTSAITITVNTTAVPDADYSTTPYAGTLLVQASNANQSGAWSGYSRGITLRGTGAQAWKNAFPNKANEHVTFGSGTGNAWVWRKLVVGS